MSDSVQPQRRQPSRLPRPWDSPGKNTGVGCHFLLQCMKVKSESEVAHSCPTLSNPMDCSPPGSCVHEAVTTVKSVNLFGGGLVSKLCLTLAIPWTVARQAPLSMGFSRQEYWSGLPFPSLGDLPNAGIEPESPALQADSLPLSHLGSP